AGHRGADLPPGQADVEGGGGELVAHRVVVEVAGADELSEGEGGPVEGVVAAAGRGGADPSDLGGERRTGPRLGGGGAGPGQWRSEDGLSGSVEAPVGEGSEWRFGHPLVAAGGDVLRGWGHDVAAVTPDVDAGAEAAGAVGDRAAGVAEPVVAAATAGEGDGRWREATVAPLQLAQGREPAAVAVHVDDDEPALGPGAHGHASVGPSLPPAADEGGVERGVVEPTPEPGVLGRAGAVRPPAAAAGHGRLVAGEDEPSSGGVGEGVVADGAPRHRETSGVISGACSATGRSPHAPRGGSSVAGGMSVSSSRLRSRRVGGSARVTAKVSPRGVAMP